MRGLTGWLGAMVLGAALPVLADGIISREPIEPIEPMGADIEHRYESLAVAAHAGDRFAVAVDLADDRLTLVREPGGAPRVLYPMAFNQVAEGWSWQPQADPAREDYYRYKFLPLGVQERQQGQPYVQEDLPGRPREVRPMWRYDYFLAFDNPYDFFPRPTVEDDAGFSAELPADAPLERGRIGMLAWARWVEPGVAESTTFWKATDGNPVDRTLKNRYLIGKLEEVWFVDRADGRVLARLVSPSIGH